MTLAHLAAENFRCFATLDFSPDPDRNLITGPNGAGKTSLLEAIFFLGRGRSFRAGEPATLRRDGSRQFTLVGQVARRSRRIPVGIRFEPGRTEVRIDGRDTASLAELASLLPVQVIEPGAHKLIEEGPARRRRFLDWGVFHVEPRFLDAWRRYQRALRQRNAGLKQGLTDAALRGFENALIEAGEIVGAFRARHVEGLRPLLDAASRQILTVPVECDYVHGWPAGKSLSDALEEGRSADRRSLTTRAGPHRADLHLRVQHRAARERVSRGEQKLLAASLILAQVDLLAALGHSPGVLLVDDPAAELDRTRLERFMEAVRERPAQLYVTALQADSAMLREGARVFHVEPGGRLEML
ncbi:MAG TPA: DNA replication/repair protein RecF [Gammaproteobacteria bacterium]|nr:DNA replication/repair protein RecF [Gammaproteobacteria bacterium]